MDNENIPEDERLELGADSIVRTYLEKQMIEYPEMSVEDLTMRANKFIDDHFLGRIDPNLLIVIRHDVTAIISEFFNK